MWKEYFHEDSVIVGVDINPECKAHEENGVHVRIGSQIDMEFLASVVKEFGPFDIVLDDGSHQNSHVIRTFDFLYPQTTDHGVYMVEDMHTSYWAKFGGGLRKPDSMIEYFKLKIDELNAVHVQEEFGITEFTRSTAGMSFYDSIAVFERSPQGKRHSIMTNRME